MTTPELIVDLKRDEGCRLTAYKDGGGVWTIGFGHTGAGVAAHLCWTQGEAEAALVADVARAYLYCLTQPFATGTILTVDGGTVLA